ncbi:MAG: nitrate reductase molybdenum cofactor assembly chaperone [Bacillota bacterium]|nr:nitrate reductase molybdenum cofactor assembly chaperone [Bacillota bacterium]
MHEQQAAILVIASRVLGYPEETFHQDLTEIEESIQEFPGDLCEAILGSIMPLKTTLLKDLRETYVATFDLKKNVGLYLTAHELGDSPKRGAALIWLQKTINQAGFDRIDNELADYMPMLYELLAISPIRDQERMVRRLAAATHRILIHLPQENPYYGIFKNLMSFVFPTPTAEEIQKLEQDREEADLEPMPYPIMYQ